MWYDAWFDAPTLKIIDDLIASGRVAIDTDSYQLRVNQIAPNFNLWLHCKIGQGERNCGLWHGVMFKYFKFIPLHCRTHCYKVVGRPRNYRELVRVHNLQWALPFLYDLRAPITSKCGLDARTSSVEPYGAFWYTNSLEQGLEAEKIIRKVVEDHMPVEKARGKTLLDTLILKKACTEFEELIPSDDPYWWNYTEADYQLELRLTDLFDVPRDNTTQPFWVWNRTIEQWAMYAQTIGDTTVAEYRGADSFSAKVRVYKPEDVQRAALFCIPSQKPLVKEVTTNGDSNKET
jgi:hypothetical protein